MTRLVMKDVDTRKIVQDFICEIRKGQTINLPFGYELVYEQENELDEHWYYIKKTKEAER